MMVYQGDIESHKDKSSHFEIHHLHFLILTKFRPRIALLTLLHIALQLQKSGLARKVVHSIKYTNIYDTSDK